VKNTDQDMKDFVIEFFPQSSSENGESAFTRDVVFRYVCMGTIHPSPIFVTEQLKEFSHVLMCIDIAKQVKQEDAWGIITRRAIWGITVSDNGSDKGKIDKGSYHLRVSALNVSIGQDFNESFFKSVG
jgi:hypothetical protein